MWVLSGRQALQGEKHGGHVQRVAARFVTGNDDDIVGAFGVSPGESRRLALGELDGRDFEVSPDTESSESENEGSGEKSGIHRIDTCER